MKDNNLVVAIVDDDETLRRTVAAYVQLQGGVPVHVDPGKDMVQLIANAKPDLVLLDLALGQHDAVELMTKMAPLGLDCSISLMSGRHEGVLDEVRAIGESKGLRMLPSLRKPFRKGDIGAVLSAATERRPADAPDVIFDVEEAIINGWLEVWYQPKLKLDGRVIIGAEALLRLRHPEHGIVPPDKFLPSAHSDAYETMTAFVIDSAARDWRELAKHSLALGLSINAGMSLIQRPSFLEMIRSAWPHGQTRPKLTVEITEDEITEDTQLVREMAHQLRLYDVAIAIDDFGAGYSSFARLRDLPFDELKLDRAFVTGCATDPTLLAFCQATAALGRHFGVVSTAEGIETAAEMEAIKACGFNIGQGYFIARPMPFESLKGSFLKRRVAA